MKFRLFVAALAAACLFPTAASAATETQRCAVVNTDPNSWVVITFSTIADQSLVQGSAAACDYLRSTGMFEADSKYVDFNTYLSPACKVAVAEGSTITVYRDSDYASRMTAAVWCSALDDGRDRTYFYA